MQQRINYANVSLRHVAADVALNINSSCNCMRVPRGGSRISGLWDNKKLVHLALGLFTLGALFQNNLGR